MLIIKDPAVAHCPPKWAECDSLLGKFISPRAFGFACAAGSLNRFRARYRLAKSFQRISLDGYTASTVEGYSALFRTFLVWSAFEQFLHAIGLDQHQCESLIAPYKPSDVVAKILAVPAHDGFLKFIRNRVNTKHQPQFDALLAGAPCNLTYVASGVRHIFAHGTLSAHAGSLTAEPATTISTILCEFLFRVMDSEFKARINNFLAKV